jgi:hypothetical protein
MEYSKLKKTNKTYKKYKYSDEDWQIIFDQIDSLKENRNSGPISNVSQELGITYSYLSKKYNERKYEIDNIKNYQLEVGSNNKCNEKLMEQSTNQYNNKLTEQLNNIVNDQTNKKLDKELNNQIDDKLIEQSNNKVNRNTNDKFYEKLKYEFNNKLNDTFKNIQLDDKFNEEFTAKLIVKLNEHYNKVIGIQKKRILKKSVKAIFSHAMEIELFIETIPFIIYGKFFDNYCLKKISHKKI